MCSKNVERPSSRLATTRPRRVGSIARKLTLLYVTSTTALLLVSGGVLYWTLERSLEHTRHGLLASKTEVLRQLLREQPAKAEALASEVEHEAAESQALKYYIRILDDRGRVLLETPGTSGLAPVSLFPQPVSTMDDLRQSIGPHVRHQGVFHLFAAQSAVGVTGEEQRTLQIAMDVSTGDTLLADYRNKLLMVLGMSMALSAVVGIWAARKGMQPLEEITRTARHITASQLHERVAIKPWPAELVDLAAAFDAMLDRLKDSFERLSQFSADLAHALRTPIHNLRGEAEVALVRPRTPEEYQHILASSLEECERLSRMIDGLLFLARADDPKTAVQRVLFDARSQLEAVREFYDALAREQEVEVSCEGQASIVGDPMLFRRAVSNLLGNALRHTPAGGTIRLTLGSLADQSVQVAVTDTGSGIAPEHLPKVFDRFYRAGEARSAVPGGIGLGLAIVQSIMRLHGGSARVESAVGDGTTITLKFPSR